MDKNYDIDQHLAQSLRTFGIQPAPDSFRAMMEKLDRKRRRKRFVILLCSGFGTLAAALLAFFVLGWQVRSGADQAPEVTRPLFSHSAPHVSLKQTGVSQPPAVATRVQNVAGQKSPFDRNMRQMPAQHSPLNPDLTNGKNKAGGLPATTIIPGAPTTTYTEKEGVFMGANEKKRDTPERSPEKELPGNGDSNTVSPTATTEPASGPEKGNTSSLPADSITRSNLPPVFLETVFPDLRGNSVYQEPVLVINTQSVDELVSLANPVKHLRLMLGLSAEPQVSRFTLAANKRRDAVFDTAGGKLLSDEYLRNKKQMNKPVFNYAYGIKAGVAFNDQWELWLGLGVQKIQFYETIYTSALQSTNSYTTFPSTFPGMAPGAVSGSSGQVRVVYNYRYYAADVKRTIQIHPFFKMNVGLGVKLDQWNSARITMKENQMSSTFFFDNQVFTNLSRWGCTIDLKAGAIYDLGRRWQFRLSPGVFYSPTSMFNRAYVILQRSYGIELEALLVYRFGKDK